jgi:aspartyl-tRNA(Asn)/glutamyl-tRNA(Gln) amidotransferase subunit A
MGENWHTRSACALGEAIGRGEIDPRALVEHFLTRIEAGDRDHVIYLRTTRMRARAEAEAAATRAASGRRWGGLDGVPISWKDIYDSAGVATEMGTPLLAGRVPERDAVVLERATRAGLVCLGKTNTVQFALGGLGTNPVTGTPANAVMEDTPRAPGGSSCGAATSVARGLAAAGIGSDTGGSVRIPAAWNRLVGLKTSFGALPTEGVLPLAPSLDTVGPLTRTVADAAALFAIMAARPPIDLAGARLDGARLLVAEGLAWEGVDAMIDEALEQAIAGLEAAGARIERGPVPEFERIHEVLERHGGVVTAEGYVTWRRYIDGHAEAIDPAVLDRFRQGQEMSAADVETVRAAVRELAPLLYRRMAGYGAVLVPAVPIVPPPIAEVLGDLDAYRAANGRALRNTRLGNMLPCCALTLPCPDPAVPAGLMAMVPAGDDARLLRVGAAMEAALVS